MIALASPRRIVLLGLMSKMPVAGVVLQTVHYLLGLQRLGFEVYYVEAHGCTPRNFINQEGDDGFRGAAEFIERVMRRYGFEGRWCYHPVFGDDRYFGMSKTGLRELYASSDLIINLHGGTEPLPEHTEHARLVFVETDPVQLQIELYNEDARAIRYLEPHCAFFSFGENLGHSDCGLSLSRQFQFRPTRQPVLLDFWPDSGGVPAGAFTTIGNWQQPYREIYYRGDSYQWSKHAEFMKFIDLPSRTSQSFELALSSYTNQECDFLKGKGWRVRHGLDVSTEVDSYISYVSGSCGEFTVAKDQNIRLRTGWFSDRSATYLAAGRPVITQDTGFGNVLPTGRGLFAFSAMDDVLGAVDAVRTDYGAHCRAAREIAREFFDAEVVLGAMLSHLGLGPRSSPRLGEPFPGTMRLVPTRRRPIVLPAATVRMSRSPAIRSSPPACGNPRISIIIVAFNSLAFTRLCLATVLTHTRDCEVIVVDNASMDGTSDYLSQMKMRDARVRVILNDHNAGFASASNQGLAAARGEILVLLNNDTMVCSGWLERLLARLDDETVGAVGPVTNRIGNEAEVDAACDTYGEYVRSAAIRSEAFSGQTFEIPTLTMFCFVMRRGIYERIGPIDERFERGMLEDDDYCRRIRDAGLRLLCAEDVLIFHFGQASFGSLVPTGEYAAILAANQQRFEEKWGEPWTPYVRRRSTRYEDEVRRVREIVEATLPLRAGVMMVSHGDDALLSLGSRWAVHFPRYADGSYSGCHPGDGANALELLLDARRSGAEFLVIPATSEWWLTHYEEFAHYLRDHCELFASEPAVTIFRLPPNEQN